MDGHNQGRRSTFRRVGLVGAVAVGMIFVAGLIGVGSVELAATFAGAGAPSGWDQANAAFGVMNSVFSALALIVVSITLWVQYRMQRLELHEQRRSLAATASASEKSAEADLRALHVELLKMAIDDRELAEVWPSYGRGVSPKRARQYLYANLIFQHQALAIRAAGREPEYVRRVVRWCLSSPIAREFWATTMSARRQIDTSDEHVKSFEQMCDEIWHEVSSAG